MIWNLTRCAYQENTRPDQEMAHMTVPADMAGLRSVPLSSGRGKMERSYNELNSGMYKNLGYRTLNTLVFVQ